MSAHIHLQSEYTVFITGASGGLGKAFAIECARRGWHLILTDRSSDSMENLCRILESTFPISVKSLSCDLSDPDRYPLLMDELRQNQAVINMLINVAGVDFEGLFMNQSLSDLQSMVRLNIEGPLALTHEVIKLRDLQTAFRIINVSSMAAFYPMPVKATYAASKRFLLDLSQALNMELRDENASVTALCPAGMPTNPHTIQSIDAQGWAGQLTTMNTGRVAYITIEAALKGKSVVVPGLVNQLVNLVGSLVPTSVKIKYIARRWMAVRSKRVAIGELHNI